MQREIEHSSDEEESSDDESDVETPSGDPQEREAERMRVLEAAGLLVREDKAGETPRPRRRPPPPRPARRPAVFDARANDPQTDGTGDEPEDGEEDIERAPELPPKPEEQAERIEDAYDVSGTLLSSVVQLLTHWSTVLPTSPARAIEQAGQQAIGSFLRHWLSSALPEPVAIALISTIAGAWSGRSI